MNQPTPILACIPDDPAARQRMTDLIGNGQAYEPYPGSTPGQCASCGGKVWIGPTQRLARGRYPQSKIYCLPCALPEAATGTPILALTAKEWPRRAAS